MKTKREPLIRRSHGGERFKEESGVSGIEYLVLLVFILMGFIGVGKFLELASIDRGNQAIGMGDPQIQYDTSTYTGLETGIPCGGAFSADGCK